MKNTILLIGFVLFSLLANDSFAAKKILISDVDDTLKLSEVRSKLGLVTRAFDTESRFAGMSELYQTLRFDNPDLGILYLSKAPEILMKEKHIEFLENSNFPKGLYLGYQAETNLANHKITQLRKILEQEKPEAVILVGDNGEQDADIYQVLRNEYPHIRFSVFIHHVYSYVGRRFSQTQMDYVTSAEVATKLFYDGWISHGSLVEFLNFMTPLILDEKPFQHDGNISFPIYLNCTSHHWQLNNKIPMLEDHLNEIQAKVESVCTQSGR